MENDDVIEVLVTLRLPISREAWNLNYGTGTGAKAVRDDVKQYTHNQVWEHFRDMGVLGGD